MTQFLNKSFSVGMAGDQEYRDRWEAIFGKKAKGPEPTEEPEPELMECGCDLQGCICYTRR